MNIWFMNSFHIQVLAVELILCWNVPRRKGFWLRFLPAGLVFLLLPEVVPGGYFTPFLMLGRFPMGFLAMLVLSGLLLALCFRLNWREVVFCCCVAHTVQHAVHALIQAVNLAFTPSAPVKNFLHLAVMLCALVLLVLARKRGLLDGMEMENAPLLTFAFFSSLLVYFLSYWAATTVGAHLFDLFCCVELLIILLDIFQLRKQKREQLMMLRILRQEQEQHRLAKANIEAINRKCHDLKHQISALRRMDPQEEKERSIGELEQAVLIYDHFTKTGNKDLDVVLTEKGLLCEQKGIQLRCIVDGKKLSFMDAADLYSLFGNAMDNAIEGVAQEADPKRRFIDLNVTPRGNCLLIHMENTCPTQPTFEDGLPSTTKGDRDYHGFGMRSMRYIAEKYDGTLSARWEDGTFILDVMFVLADKSPAVTIT